MKNYVFTLQLFESTQYEHGFSTIEYRAKNIIRDIVRSYARNGRLFFNAVEVEQILHEAYSIAGLTNVSEMVKQKMWYATKENWIAEVA